LLESICTKFRHCNPAPDCPPGIAQSRISISSSTRRIVPVKMIVSQSFPFRHIILRIHCPADALSPSVLGTAWNPVIARHHPSPQSGCRPITAYARLGDVPAVSAHRHPRYLLLAKLRPSFLDHSASALCLHTTPSRQYITELLPTHAHAPPPRRLNEHAQQVSIGT
jgi:hypothetical protein